MEATDWFRVRHRQPFSEQSFATFRASCEVFRAQVETTLRHWDDLPALAPSARPTLHFLAPEISEDRKVMSLPVGVEGKTLTSRSWLQTTASQQLYRDLPVPLMVEVEVGLTEPDLDGDGWRHDWWNPNLDADLSPEQAFAELGFKVQKVPFTGGHAVICPASTNALRRALLVMKSWRRLRRRE